MASLFARYRTPTFVAPYTDEEWDNVRQAIRNNRRDIDKELIKYALVFMSKSPQLASLVPFLSSELNVTPDTGLDGTIETIEGILDNIHINRV